MAERIFVPNPDSYGRFGHYTLNILSAALLAHHSDGWFLPKRYQYFTTHWNNYVDWSASKRAASTIGGNINHFFELFTQVHSDGINCTYNLDTIEGIGSILADSAMDGALYLLPFNQLPGRLLTGNESIRKDLSSCFSSLVEFSAYSDVCIHVRRGDVDQKRHPEWFINDDVYRVVVRSILETWPNAKITIISQLNSDGSRPLAEISSEFAGKVNMLISNSIWSNSEEVDAFAALMNSGFIIGGRSSFCQAAYYTSPIAKRFVSLAAGNDFGFLPRGMIDSLNISEIDSIENELKLLLGQHLAARHN